MSNKFPTMLASIAALAALQALVPLTVSAQGANPLVLPGLSGETPLQQTVGNAVLTMCAERLDNNRNLTALQNDLHDQCHAIAVADILAKGGAGSAAAPLGALQQVSGNQVSSQGALATRVVAGQFANISGRLNALRLGGAAGVNAGHVTAFNSGNSSSPGSLASAGPQTFYLDRSMLDAGTRGDGFAPAIQLPLGFQSQGSLTNTAFVSDGSLKMPRSDSASSAQSTGNGSSASAFGSSVPNPWGVYLQGSYNSGHHEATPNEDPFDFHAVSLTAGLDHNFGHAVLGASVGYDDYNAGFGTLGTLVSGGGAKVEGTSGSLYGEYTGQAWYVSGIATYGRLTTTLSRVVDYTVSYAVGADPDPQATINDHCGPTTCTVSVDRVLRGDPDGHTVAVGATVGYDYSAYSWDIEPSLTGSYRRATFSSFVEHDTGPTGAGSGLALAFGDQTVESLRSILGVAFSRPFSSSIGVFTPTVRVEWDHEFKTNVRGVDAHYAYDPSAGTDCLSCFSLPTDATPSNYGIAGAGVAVLLPGRLQLYLYDETLFGFANYRSNSVVVGLRGQF